MKWSANDLDNCVFAERNGNVVGGEWDRDEQNHFLHGFLDSDSDDDDDNFEGFQEDIFYVVYILYTDYSWICIMEFDIQHTIKYHFLLVVNMYNS